MFESIVALLALFALPYCASHFPSLQSSLEERPYKIPAIVAEMTRNVYRARPLAPRKEERLLTPGSSTGDRVYVEDRSRKDRHAGGSALTPVHAHYQQGGSKGAYSYVSAVARGSRDMLLQRVLIGKRVFPHASGIQVASWYGPGFHGRRMANGERFDMNDPTVVAHKELPFGTRIRATNLKNGRSIIATVSDRGPFIPGRDLDFSKAGASRLGFEQDGITTVRVEILSSPS